jgi:peroxiredoxin
MSAHIRSTVAPSTELVMGVPGAFSEKISNFTLPQFGEIASGW